MPDPTEGATLPEPAAPLPPRKRGLAWLAWLAILGAVAFEVTSPYLRPEDDEPTAKERAAEILMESQGRVWVGLAQMAAGTKPDPRAQRDQFDTGPLEQRFRFVILTGELVGPGAALEELHRLDERVEARGVHPNEVEAKERDILGRLYQDYREAHPDAPSLSEDERDFLAGELGWTGRLALAPEGGPNPAARDELMRSARRAATVNLLFLGGLLPLVLAGLLGLILLVVLLATGNARPRFRVGSDCGGIYAEAFAVWMLLFMATRYVVSYALEHNLLSPALPRFPLSIGLSLLEAGAALGWPLLRGVPWQQLRQDLGLTFGRRPWAEPAFGCVGYVLALPLLAVGVLAVVVAMHLRQRLRGVPPEDNFSASDIPAHPITEILARPDAALRVQVFILACVVAPLVEEVLFRGLLYRHLRETSRSLGRLGSFLVSATAVSFVFAAIHPQGVLGLPALMALAFGFALLREWRGSLVPVILAHGLNNSIVLAVSLLTLPN